MTSSNNTKNGAASGGLFGAKTSKSVVKRGRAFLCGCHPELTRFWASPDDEEGQEEGELQAAVVANAIAWVAKI